MSAQTPADTPSGPTVLELARFDCEVLALLTSARLRDPAAEQRRSALLDAVNRAGRDAARRLEAYTRHAISESHGSRSTWNVTADARAFFDSLAAYAALVHRTVEQLAALAERDASWRGAQGQTSGDAEPARGRLRVL
jgi:hypothetical protein